MTRSQWREVSRGVKWECLRRLKTIQAAIFWMSWRGLIADAGRPAKRDFSSSGRTKPLLGSWAGPSRGWERGGFSGYCIGRIFMTGSPPQSSRRGTVCSPSLLAWGVGVTGVSHREEEVRVGMKIISDLPGLSFRCWLKPVCQIVRRRKLVGCNWHSVITGPWDLL